MPSAEVSHRIDLGPQLPEHIVPIAREQGENPDHVSQHIQELRDMVYAQGLCKPHRLDDPYLLKFLRARFFNVDNAYKLLCRHCQFRDANKELHVNVHPLALKSLAEQDIVTVTPNRCQNGRRMMIYKIGKWRPSKIPIEDLFRATLVLLEIGSMEPQAQILGGIGIFDLEGLSLNHIWHVGPATAQKIISLMVTCMPHRTTALHIVNQSWAFNAAFQVFKPFLNDRMREKIYIHGTDLSSLHKHIDPEHLPTRYGGKIPNMPYTKWLEATVDSEQILLELRQLGYVFDTEELDFYRKSG